MTDKIEGIGYDSLFEMYRKGKISDGKYVIVSGIDNNNILYEIHDKNFLKFNNLLYPVTEIIDNNEWHI